MNGSQACAASVWLAGCQPIRKSSPIRRTWTAWKSTSSGQSRPIRSFQTPPAFASTPVKPLRPTSSNAECTSHSSYVDARYQGMQAADSTLAARAGSGSRLFRPRPAGGRFARDVRPAVGGLDRPFCAGQLCGRLRAATCLECLELRRTSAINWPYRGETFPGSRFCGSKATAALPTL